MDDKLYRNVLAAAEEDPYGANSIRFSNLRMCIHNWELETSHTLDVDDWIVLKKARKEALDYYSADILAWVSLLLHFLEWSRDHELPE